MSLRRRSDVRLALIGTFGSSLGSPSSLAISRAGLRRASLAGVYCSEHDHDNAVAVWLMRGPVSADEWKRHLSDMETIRTWSRHEKRPLVLLDVADFAPTALQRADIAARSGHDDYRPILAFVTPSPLARAALRAIHWVAGPPSYVTEFFETADSAIPWLEGKRGCPAPELRALHAAALRQLR